MYIYTYTQTPTYIHIYVYPHTAEPLIIKSFATHLVCLLCFPLMLCNCGGHKNWMRILVLSRWVSWGKSLTASGLQFPYLKKHQTSGGFWEGLASTQAKEATGRVPGARQVPGAYGMDSLFHQFLGSTFGGLYILSDKSSLYSGEQSLAVQRQISGQLMRGGGGNQTKGWDKLQRGEIGKLAPRGKA